LNGPAETLKSVLKLTQNLVRAHIGIAFDNGPWPDTDEIITLHHLRYLHVTNLASLRFLKAPVLEGLAFCVNGYPPDIVLAFLDRSRCPLRRLYLSGSPDARSATRIFGKLGSITELIIGHEVSGFVARNRVNALIVALTTSNLVGSTVLVPHLRLVVVACGEDHYIDYATFVQMLKSRRQGAHCALKSAGLFIDAGLRPLPAVFDDLHMLH
jgi:hypothetical protein